MKNKLRCFTLLIMICNHVYALECSPLPTGKIRALADVEQCAKNGNHYDLYQISTYYLYGKNGYQQNIEKSTDLLRDAAKLGNLEAAYNLGIRLIDGAEYTPEKGVEGLFWLKHVRGRFGDANAFDVYRIRVEESNKEIKRLAEECIKNKNC